VSSGLYGFNRTFGDPGAGNSGEGVSSKPDVWPFASSRYLKESRYGHSIASALSGSGIS